MKKQLLLLIIVLTLILILGTAERNKDYPWSLDYSYQISTGNSNPNLQEYSFEVLLSHNEYKYLNNVAVTYKINAAFLDKIKENTPGNSISIGTMKKKDVFNFKGKIKLNTHGLTKKQIDSMGPVIESFTVTWEQDNKKMKQSFYYR